MGLFRFNGIITILFKYYSSTFDFNRASNTKRTQFDAHITSANGALLRPFSHYPDLYLKPPQKINLIIKSNVLPKSFRS